MNRLVVVRCMGEADKDRRDGPSSVSIVTCATLAGILWRQTALKLSDETFGIFARILGKSNRPPYETTQIRLSQLILGNRDKTIAANL